MLKNLRSFHYLFVVTYISAFMLGILPSASGYSGHFNDHHSPETPTPANSKHPSQKIEAGADHLPITFVPNHGQLKDETVQFQANTLDGSIFFKPGAFHLVLPNWSDQKDPKNAHKDKMQYNHPPYELITAFLGFNPETKGVGAEMLPGKMNYLIGQDHNNWVTDVETYDEIQYAAFYPGIDLVVNGKESEVKTSFLVSPHTDTSVIRWIYQGADQVSVDKNGNLVVVVSKGNKTRTIQESAPVAWQVIDGLKVDVPVEFSLNAQQEVSFAFPYGFQAEVALVIDPTLTWSTLIGNDGTDRGYHLALDSSGNTVITGFSYCTAYPLVNQLYGSVGGRELIVTKLNSTGNSILYSTCIGGSDDEYGNAIALDASDNIYVAGQSMSSNFPIVNGISTFGGGSCSSLNCSDAFMVKINSAGNAILFSTYIGGSKDDIANALALDGSGNVYIAGQTNSSNFPATANGYDTSFGGGTCSGVTCLDGFVTRINPSLTGAASLTYSSFLGGGAEDKAYDIAVDSSKKVYVAGATDVTSSGWPVINSVVTGGAQNQAALTKMDLTLSGASSVISSSLLGGDYVDEARVVAVDNAGNAYLAGYTESQNFPTKNAYISGRIVNCTSTCQDIFVAKISTSTNVLVYSTYLGGNGKEKPTGITFDSYGRAYVVGYSNSTDYPLVNTLQGRSTDGCTTTPCDDPVLSVLRSDGAALEFSTYFGGSADDYINGIRLDVSGNIFLAGYTYSSDFPTTAGAYDTSNLEPNVKTDVFVSKIAALAAPITPPSPPEVIVSDGFETGNLNAWTYAVTNGGNLSATAAALDFGSYGMQATISGNTAMYVVDEAPLSEPRYRMRFYFHPNGITMANNDAHYIFYAYQGSNTTVYRMELRYASNAYSVRVVSNNDAGSSTNSNWFTLTNAWHYFETDWLAATAAGANNGFLTFWMDGVQKVSLTAIDNDTQRIDRVALGPVSGIDNGTRGSYYFDAFEAHRTTAIGAYTAAPTPTPTATQASTPTPTATFTPTPTPTATFMPTPTLLPQLGWNGQSDQGHAYYGWSVSSGQDINGDGYDDVVIGAPSYDPTLTEIDAGAVFVYYGSSTGLRTNPDLVLTSHETGARFGWAVASAGDVNHDGYDDLLVGAIGCSHTEKNEGCAYLYMGSSSGLNATPAWSVEGNQPYASLGYAVGLAGNVNDDVYSDIFVSAPNYSNGETNEGIVNVYQGSSSGLSSTASWSAEGNQANAYFGLAVSSAGDVNGNGIDDLIIGAPNASGDQLHEGKAYVFLGIASGLSPTPSWTAEGNQADAHFGEAVSTAGDLNHDGRSEVVVGAPDYDWAEVDAGAVYVFFGSVSGLNAQAGWAGANHQASSHYGIAVAFAGDMDLDSYDDLLISSNQFTNGEEKEGAIYLYYGSAAGINDNRVWIQEGNDPFANFGYCVTAAGDVNSDGIDDIIVGAPQFGNTDTGRVFLYYGAR